ncbi:unnamed protein product [Polarella glacialis]|uniref:Uncharacterized protein n=1 Tax=Polarella glacialis TaxID=89957 RepID=A0A813D0L4_POLGL|nr:unnamed protein product [Polarella glacialis]
MIYTLTSVKLESNCATQALPQPTNHFLNTPAGQHSLSCCQLHSSGSAIGSAPLSRPAELCRPMASRKKITLLGDESVSMKLEEVAVKAELAEPDSDRATSSAFRAATDVETSEGKELLSGRFKEWLGKAVNVEDCMTIVSNLLRLLDQHQKAPACMASADFPASLPATNDSAKAALEQWRKFWIEDGRTAEEVSIQDSEQLLVDAVAQLMAQGKTEQVKTEPKEETTDDLDDLLNGTSSARLHKKHKSKKGDEDGADLQAPPSAEDLAYESDTQYEEVDVSKSLEALRIEASSYDKIDGLYKRLEKSSRGRPAYWNSTSRKMSYLYWNKGWKISFAFGSSKCAATVKDVEGVDLPIEPYPVSWKVIDKSTDDQKKKTALTMRVIDESVYASTLQNKDGGQPVAPLFPTATRIKKREKKMEKSVEPAVEGSPAKKKREAGEAKPKRASGATKAAAADDDEAAMVEAAAGQDSDDENKAPSAQRSSQHGSDSDDDKDDSSESSGSESSSEEVKPSPKAIAEVAITIKPSFQAMNSAARAFVSATGLMKLPAEQAHAKAQKLRDTLFDRIRKGEKIPQMISLQDAQQIISFCDREYGTGDKVKERQPAAPPPRHLLGPGNVAPSTPDGAPQTPPGALAAAGARRDEELPPHRRGIQPLKCAIRKGPRGVIMNFQRRIQYGPYGPQISQVKVATYKTSGDTLWFSMPGAYVFCDACLKAVPQSMGSLQGAPQRSQFAQDKFLCTDCMMNGRQG